MKIPAGNTINGGINRLQKKQKRAVSKDLRQPPLIHFIDTIMEDLQGPELFALP